jgi:hypothetical protein
MYILRIQKYISTVAFVTQEERRLSSAEDELQNSTQGIYCNELGKEKVLMVLH